MVSYTPLDFQPGRFSLLARAAKPVQPPGPGQEQALHIYRRYPYPVRVPETLRRPDIECQHRADFYVCTRALDHRGRHAQINWVTRIVRAEWGVRDRAEQFAPVVERWAS